MREVSQIWHYLCTIEFIDNGVVLKIFFQVSRGFLLYSNFIKAAIKQYSANKMKLKVLNFIKQHIYLLTY